MTIPHLRSQLLLAGLYLGATVSLQWIATFFNDGQSLSLWYLPSGLTFAFLAVCGWRWAPWTLVVSVTSNVFTSAYDPNVVAAIPGILAYAGAAAALNRLRRGRPSPPTAGDLARLGVIAATASAAAALGNVSLLYLSGTFTGPLTVTPYINWWVGDLVGIITLSPLLLIVLESLRHAAQKGTVLRQSQVWFQQHHRELRLILLVVTATVCGVYTVETRTGLHIAFLYFLPLLWLSLRSTLLLSVIGVFLMNAGIIVTFSLLELTVPQQRDAQLLITSLTLVSLLVSILELQRRTQEQELHHQLAHDPLTGLTSRVAFQPAVKTLIRDIHPDQRLLLLFVDIDRLKHINDSHGHLVGDEYLKHTAVQLQQAARKIPSIQTVIARLSGDEFAVAARVTDEQETALVRAIQDCIQRPVRIAGHELRLAFSVGVSSISLHDHNGQTLRNELDLVSLIQQADEAMYQAKRTGQSLQWYTPPSVGGLSAVECERGLRHALETGDEFVVYYQPLIDLHTHELLGCEALIRWQHPVHGLLSPAAFLPVAERTGLIVPLGRWVLWTACKQMGVWREHYRPLRISINVDAQQFHQDIFVQDVLEAVREGGIAADQLDLELTENAVLLDAPTATQHLDVLRSHGVRLALDDFGIGYSSLSHLRDFHVHVLKIDRSFTRNLLHEGRDLHIVQAMVALGHSLEMRVLIEGIETTAQLEKAAALGCDEAQGYLLGHPVPPAEFETVWLREKEF
ncbi:putative bifunctional diguanylate cyclase/phosphodiesterase [Deinococcus aquatilis]|uniref:putative bifunctional diguanylate cyclase/phosphodiesterase n=1 Tax=Deinococcus aquatilis TaxID=519440 RepID=UPI00037D414E|nr:EAL domain-containing protein [Deinococcus aquatilis]